MNTATDFAGIVAIQAVRGDGLPHYVRNDALSSSVASLAIHEI